MKIKGILEKIFADYNIDRVQLAEMLEIHYSTVTLWMTGKREPSSIQCLALAGLASGKERVALQEMANLSDALIEKIIRGLSDEGEVFIQPEQKAFLSWFTNPPEPYDESIREYILRRVKSLKQERPV